MSDDDEVFFEATSESAPVQPTAKVWNRVLGVEGRLELDEQWIAAVENDSQKLLRAVVAILSHAIRRQHLPPGLTFDSELWDRLRDVGGSEACAEVTEEIQRTQSMLRRTCGNNGGAE